MCDITTSTRGGEGQYTVSMASVIRVDVLLGSFLYFVFSLADRYLWEAHHMVDQKSFVKDLSSSLAMEIGLELHKHMVVKVRAVCHERRA